jgi:hypothetical protein
MAAATAEKSRKAEEERNDAKFRETVNGRLSALSAQERAVVAYCVSKNQQSIEGSIGNATLSGLSHKLLLVRGAGYMNSLPWSFTDDVWRVIQSRGDEFMPTPQEKKELEEKLPKFLRDDLY